MHAYIYIFICIYIYIIYILGVYTYIHGSVWLVGSTENMMVGDTGIVYACMPSQMRPNGPPAGQASPCQPSKTWPVG